MNTLASELKRAADRLWGEGWTDSAEAVEKAAAEVERLERLEGVVAKLPRTADGAPIVHGMIIYWPVKEDIDYWGVDKAGEAIAVRVISIMAGAAFPEYKGDFTIGCAEGDVSEFCRALGCSDVEGGNLEFYSTIEAALAQEPRQ